MKPKPLIIIESDPELKALSDAMGEGEKVLKESMEFLKKQAKNMWAQHVGVHWDSIEQILKERNLLPPDYEFGVHDSTTTKYGLTFRDGILYLNDNNDPSNIFAKSLADLLFGK